MPIPKRILIVDDDPDIHQLLAEALQASNRHIDSAADGLQGLARVQAAPYDLVITDVTMPGLSGLELLEQIHKIRPATRVVVMTVASTPEDVIRALREQAFTYLSKPFTIPEVSHLVDTALESTPSDDDIEVLSAQPHWLSVRLRCKAETADRILHFLREIAIDLPPNERENIATAFREILSNAIEHGGDSDPNKHVFITYVRGERALFYYVRDPGKGFSFEDIPHAAVSNPTDSPTDHVEVRQRRGMRPGGFGIFMTRQLVDEMIYNEKGNEVLLIKYLEQGPQGTNAA
jgi:DNA-binding response OmpR family regulator